MASIASAQPRLTPPKGASLPVNCNTGDLFTKTTATAGLYVCISANTWSPSPLGSGGGGTPGGSTTQVQFNDSGSFGGNAGLVYDKVAQSLTVTHSGSAAAGFNTSNTDFSGGTAPSHFYQASDGSTFLDVSLGPYIRLIPNSGALILSGQGGDIDIDTANGSGVDLGDNGTANAYGAWVFASTITATDFKVGSTSIKPLRGVTGSIGGSLLAAGACTGGTATVSGATTGMVATASPVSDPDPGLSTGVVWDAFVSSANTVTVRVCGLAAVTPNATTYQVSVVQ